MRSLVRALPMALCFTTLSNASLAADTWTNPYPGVRHLYRTTADPLRVHALVVNLCNPGVKLRATASTERKRTTSSFGNLVSAKAAINGDFFSYASYATTGLSIGNGIRWTDTADSSSAAMAAFGSARAVFSPAAEVVSSPPSWMTEVVSGRPDIVRNGSAITSYDCSGHYCQREPRTALGFSKNRRTLYLVVVDGRSSVSIGVTLPQLANILAGLGVHDGLNLDGGGSTTMWLANSGVVNAPSAGSQRVVANHLAVHADGSGFPGSCVEDPEEVVFLDDASSTTDVNGDGLADVCARAAAGFRCYLSDGSTVTQRIDGPELTDDAGWNAPANYGTIRMGDLNGDGLADVCARANAGLRCWLSEGSSFGPTITGPAWSNDAGWNDLKYYSTIRLADIDGDGMDDVCGRGPDGIVCHRSTGSGFGPAIPGPSLTDGSGWGVIGHYGTIRYGDINGDGKVDICARAGKGMLCWPSQGDSFGTPIDGPVWSNDAGWNETRYWSTIRLADIDGDGRDDLCGRGPEGIICHKSEGTGFGPAIMGPELSDASGWADHSNYMTLRMADVTGDGRMDLCARANAGFRCWPSNGNGFGPSFAGPDWSDDAGWFQAKHFATIRLADIDGDGRADVCGRSADRVHCWLSDGAGFPTQVQGPELADSVGWGALPYWATLRVAGPRPKPAEPELDAGVEGGVEASVETGVDAPISDTSHTEDGEGETQPGDGGTIDGSHGGEGSDSWASGGDGGDGGGCACIQTGTRAGQGKFAILFALGLLVWGRRRIQSRQRESQRNLTQAPNDHGPMGPPRSPAPLRYPKAIRACQPASWAR